MQTSGVDLSVSYWILAILGTSSVPSFFFIFINRYMFIILPDSRLFEEKKAIVAITMETL